MIQLNGNIAFDETKAFAEQTDEVKQTVIDTCYSEGLFEPPYELKMKVASAGSLAQEETITSGNNKTTFDRWARPRVLVIDKGTYSIMVERTYIEQATNWRLDNEQFTVTLKQ
ncbi:hypothetical protein [uncultured Acetobacteroides sp.]|uniref:hypothetical protein n=1 Tax=uncultured Acetobacteroides sp. TaxID=1760811 RepID=UPI0029F4C2EC|nr:hypothetical protein [uncultured Acetobacteroides sp.]